ncbi:MAG: caspase family protein, partial [Blastocatellia bacterium]
MGIPLNFNQPNLRQRLAKMLAVSLFLGLFVPLAQARKQNDQRGVSVRRADPVNTLPEKSKRYALIIGVDKYADSSISPLDGASNDAKTLADALVRYAGFPADQVILLANDQPPQRLPTREEILLRLSNLRGAVPKDGLLLIAFAGHGIERNGQAYLLASNARIHGDIELLQDTSISVTRMKDAIRAVGVGQVVLFLDACRNDPASGRSDSVNPLTNAYTRGFNFDVRNREVTAFATFYATEVGKRAYEYTEKRQGYFTWALVEGLKGEAANERGEVTLSRLIRHVQEAVPKRVLLDLGRNVSQKPFAVVEGYRADELVIAFTESRAPVISTDAEIAYWNSIKDSGNAANFKAYLDDFPNGRFRRLAENRLRELGAAPNRPPVVDPAPSRPNALTPVIPLPRGVDPSRLAAHNFTTATVDANGAVRKFVGTPTQQYTEDLGNGVRLEMVAVKGGTFTMGSFAGEAGRGDDEGPRRQVR